MELFYFPHEPAGWYILPFSGEDPIGPIELLLVPANDA